MMPRPTALRLVTRATDAATPKPLFGLPAWSAEAEAIAVLLDGDAATGLDVSAIAAQIPHARESPPGTTVVVLGPAAKDRRPLRRWLGPREKVASRAARCTALLARGYVDLGAGADPTSGVDMAWGSAPPRDITTER
ncbi:MAG: hypothetical protein M3O36_05845 [Myxococcota bacterium]|nr:hypothetical protein [Myxococcota bacterium]